MPLNTAPPFRGNAGCLYGCAKSERIVGSPTCERQSTKPETKPWRPSPQNVEEELLSQESAHQIHQRLHALPEPYREVFTLRVFAELPYGQIGELFGKSETWARVTYYRAKQKIKEGLL